MAPRQTRFALLIAVIGAIVWLTAAAVPRPAHAQSGVLSITTDKTQYQVGDPIQICYTVAAPGPISISTIQSDGISRVFFSGVDDGTGGCVSGTVTPPAGTECLVIAVTGIIGSSAQTCFQIGGSVPPGPCIQIYPAPPGCGASISTDQTQYFVGSPIRVCYTVPGPGSFTITDNLADGTSRTFFSGVDDGRGGCLAGTVTRPVGTECLLISSSGGPGGNGQTCFQVMG